MKENRSSWVLLGILALFVLVYFLYQPVNWDENYKVDNKGAYGLSILKEILPAYSGQREVLFSDEPFQTKKSELERPANYFVTTDFLHLDSSSLHALLEFVEEGNTALIASKELPENLVDALLSEISESDLYGNYVMNRLDSNLVFTLSNPSLNIKDSLTYNFYKQGLKSFHYLWSHLPQDWFSEYSSSIEQLGTIEFKNESFANFARVSYGEGNFILHSTPLIFTNFYLIKEDHVSYAENILSYLNDGPILWDNHAAQIAGQLAKNQRNPQSTERTPLKYILSQPALAWAWYLLLFMGLLYLIFRAKRQQRIIPVLVPNTNTSLEFVKTLGQLYFQNGNPKHVSQQKMLYLQEHIRVRYHLQSNDWDTDFKEKLAQKSSAPIELVNKIDFLFKNIQKSHQISENTLMDFHNYLQQFYEYCK